MKFLRALKATVTTGALAATSQLAVAQNAFNNTTGNGISVGKIATNMAGSLSGVSALMEALLYVIGVAFIVVFVLLLWKWKKSDGREGSPSLIAVSLIVAVCAIAAPTLMGSGISTLFGTGTVQTVKQPTATF